MSDMPVELFVLTIRTGEPTETRFYVRRRGFWTNAEAHTAMSELPETHIKFASVARLTGVEAYRLRYLKQLGGVWYIDEEVMNA